MRCRPAAPPQVPAELRVSAPFPLIERAQQPKLPSPLPPRKHGLDEDWQDSNDERWSVISECTIRVVLVDCADDSNPRPVIFLVKKFVRDSVPGRDLVGPFDDYPRSARDQIEADPVSFQTRIPSCPWTLPSYQKQGCKYRVLTHAYVLHLKATSTAVSGTSLLPRPGGTAACAPRVQWCPAQTLLSLNTKLPSKATDNLTPTHTPMKRIPVCHG